MDNKKKEPGITIPWEFEEYIYTHSFNLKRNIIIPAISRNGNELKKPDFLYKFYGKSNYNLHSLFEGYLYFSNPRNFNDPFDCLTNREEYIFRRGSQKTKEHRESLGVCCFSLIKDNPLMWGHYTDKYNGFCLKFKNVSLFKSDDINIVSHVSYLKNYEPSNKNLKECKSRVDQTNLPKEKIKNIKDYLYLYFEYCWKYYDWQYEQEFRAISDKTDKFNRKYFYNKKDVEEIYIGYKMKETDIAYYDFIIEFLKNHYSNTKVYEVKPNPFLVKLDFNELSIAD